MQDWEDWELDWKIRRLESQRMSSMMERIKARKKREKLLEKHPSKKNLLILLISIVSLIVFVSLRFVV